MTLEDRAIAVIRQSTAWITQQRWFGDKARPVTSCQVDVVHPVEVGDAIAALIVARFSFEWGPDARYFVPLLLEQANEPAQERGGDALAHETFLRWFVEGFDEQRRITGAGTWSWREMGDGLPDAAAVGVGNARAIPGEQSNTSIVFDQRFIGKVFRRLQPGLNPDLEIGEFLSTGGRFPHAPKLYGVVEVEYGSELLALAAMQEFVPNHADGWTWLLEQLRAITEASLPGMVDAVRLLGRRTAGLHVALASDDSREAFAPEPFDHDDAQALIKRVIAEIDESVEGLVRHLPPQDVERIHKGMGQLMGDAHSLGDTHKIRVHGDYHLGQTLRTLDDDFTIIDFEGEPSRTMEQRRMKLPALKDVAGMVRSLDYAAATVLQDATGEDQRRLVEQWLTRSTEAFVASYREAVAQAPVRLVPERDDVFTRALNLLIAEKALYEVRYELNNRPAWLPIPLNAIQRLVGMDIAGNVD